MTDDVTPDASDEKKDVAKPAGNRGLGRKKGSKNKSTLLREALNNNFEAQLQDKFHQVVSVVLDQAINEGCRQSQKMLLDRIVPTVHAESDKDKNPFAGGISITIGSLETKGSVSVAPEVIDGDYEEINNEE